MFLRMLLPRRILHPDGVSSFVILLLQRIEETPRNPLLRPKAEPPAKSQQNHYRKNPRNNPLLALPLFFGIVLFSVQKCHDPLAYRTLRRTPKFPKMKLWG